MSSNRQSRIRFAPALAALAGAGLLGACVSPTDPPPSDKAALSPLEQYPLRAREMAGELKLAAHPEGLSPSEREALADLADRWTRSGGGDLTIRIPSSGADRRAAERTGREVEVLLAALGVPEQRLRRVDYAPDQGGAAPIVVAYLTFQAEVPRCGQNWENLSTNGQNRPMQNFGCAVSANLAAQIADPADIAGPRTADPTDAGRRTAVIEKYRQGQATGGTADGGASGTMSSLGGGGSN